MADFYTSWYSYGSGGQFRLRLYIEDPPASTSASSVTLTSNLYIETKGTLNDSVNNNTLTGSLGSASGSANVSIGSGGGSVKVQTITKTVSLAYSGITPIEVVGSIYDYEALGDRYKTGNVTCPKRSYTKPSAPSGLTETAITHTSATLNWANEPSDWGGNDTGDYELQYSTTSAFTGAPVISVTNAMTKAVSGLVAGTKYYWRVRGTNTAGDGTWSGIADWTTSSYTTPAAPSGVAAARNSDIKATVTWTPNPTSGAPYSSQTIQRAINGANWTTLSSSLSGTAGSYIDSSIQANRKYTYRVSAKNTAGTSGYATSGNIYTTPGTPTNAVAVKNTTNGIVISWTENSNYTEATTLVERSTDGGAWTALISLPVTTTTHTDPAPDLSKKHQYRVVTRTSIAPTLVSGYATTAVVQLAAPPAAPTNLKPSGGALNATNAITFTWVHNPVDSSPQTKFQVQHRAAGGAWTPVTQASSASQWILPANTYPNGTTVEWQVQTWGVATTGGTGGTGGSPFSATASFTLSSPPVATILTPTPAEVVPSSIITTTWQYFDAESTVQTGWSATLKRDGQVLETLEGVDASTEATFLTPGLDDIEYTIEVVVRDSANMLSLPGTVTFSVNYPLPADIVTVAEYDPETGTVLLNLQPVDPPPAGEVEVVTANIERRIDGGPWVTIARGVSAYASVLDTSPGIHNTNEYRTTGFAAAPTFAAKVMDPTVTVVTEEQNRGFLSTGASFDYILMLECDQAVDASSGLDKTLHQFFGRLHPLEFSGVSRDKVVNVSGTTTGGHEDWEAIGYTPSIVLWRDPTGRHVYGSISPVATGLVNMGFPDIWTVGFSVTEVDYAG